LAVEERQTPIDIPQALVYPCHLKSVDSLHSMKSHEDNEPQRSLLDLVLEHSLTSALKLKLERMIFDGSIGVGERLNESVLAAQFGTSRGPLREALQALGEQGLVSFTRNRGAFVRNMSSDEAQELYDLRAALDDEVGRKLASTMSEDESAELETLLRAMDKQAKAGDIRGYYPNNLRFHDLLVTYAGNKRLAEVYRRITKELHLFRLRGLYAGGAMTSNVEHWNILKAIQSGSSERAAAAMREHIEAARARMLKALKRR
jgi:DNA-binding GntR family transcriptional regulator